MARVFFSLDVGQCLEGFAEAHVVSEDAVHWTHLPVALEPDSLGYIFSGSAVYDRENRLLEQHRDGLRLQSLVYDENGSDPSQEADWGEKVYSSRFGSALQDEGERILALRNKRYLSRFKVLAEETFDLRLHGEFVGGDEILGESAPIRSRNGYKIPFKWVREGHWRTHFSESTDPGDRQILDGSMNIIVWASDTIHEVIHLQWQSRVTYFNK